MTSLSTEIIWSPTERLAGVRYTPGVTLMVTDGDFLAGSPAGWIGTARAPFSVLADATGLRRSNAEYRARASGFFRKRLNSAFIALINLGPVLHVVVPLETFPSEPAARFCLGMKATAG